MNPILSDPTDIDDDMDDAAGDPAGAEVIELDRRPNHTAGQRNSMSAALKEALEAATAIDPATRREANRRKVAEVEADFWESREVLKRIRAFAHYRVTPAVQGGEGYDIISSVREGNVRRGK
ncbi:hypothetical protein D7D52_26985 [Nocardia yunnanensis]|uniref:Uncharacterized protein n=1 Tax=Nocardia yunnanensis TaxID=2382165 RepID=A0A386ZJQ0_9NOCA|nr:hypothetical protein [Nocardia yunnanensis]AYF76849.1 hypothetical protein D7D52_26985 [Nocardia yunnanensis]